MALTMKQTEELFALYMNSRERVRKLPVEKNITPAELAEMANALGISIDELVGLKD